MRFAQQRSAKVVLMVIPSPRAETNLVEVTLLARLHADLPEHHAREQPHVPREHVQPNLVVGGRTLREVGQVGADAIAEHLEQRRVVLERRARRRGRDDPAEQGREVHRDGGLLPVVVKLQVGRRRHLDGGASLDGLATYARAKANDKAPVSLPRALLSRASIAACHRPASVAPNPRVPTQPRPPRARRSNRTRDRPPRDRRRLVAVAARATRRPRPVRDARILRIPHDVSTRASRPRPRAFGALARHSDASYPPRIPRDAIRASRLLASTRRDARARARRRRARSNAKLTSHIATERGSTGDGDLRERERDHGSTRECGSAVRATTTTRGGATDRQTAATDRPSTGVFY